MLTRTDKQTYIQADRRDRQTDRPANRQTSRHAGDRDRETERQRETDRQTNRPTDRQADKQASRCIQASRFTKDTLNVLLRFYNYTCKVKQR